MSKKEDFQDNKKKLTEMLRSLDKGRQKSPSIEASSNGGGSTASDNERIDTDFTIKEIMDDRVALIKDAIRRINNGSYGTCLNCKKEIVRERLEAIPEAIFCIDCQKKKERQAESMMNLRDTFFPDQIS